MPSALPHSPKLADPKLPITETQAVLLALERLDPEARKQVLSAAIAFYGIGNSELNVVQ